MKTLTVLAASLVILGATAPARAQAPAGDAQWSAWLGCWNLVRENLREDAAPAAVVPASATAPRVCVAPAGDRGVTLTTTVQGQPALEQTVVADGKDHPITDGDCRGSQRAEWSRDGGRLYAHADLTCAADQAPRTVSGVTLIAADGSWLDIQAVRLGSSESTRVRRYRRAAGQPATASALRVGTAFSLDDVKDAAARVSPRVIEAALVETRAGFDLTGRDMIGLSEAKVPASILDLLVALSYPKQFVVERASRPEPLLLANDPYLLGWSYGSPFMAYGADDFFYPNYYYTPFAYSYAGSYFGPYGYYGPGLTVIDVGPGGGSTEPQPSGTGRVVNGLGYTRVRPRESQPAQPAVRGSSGGNRAAGSGDSGSAAASSGGGATASPQGYSSGGSSDGGGGRTAQPR